MRLSRIRLTPAALLPLLICGCSAVSSVPSSVPSPTAAAAPASGAALENYPIDAYTFSNLQDAEQRYVTADLIHSCMLRFGFNYREYRRSPSRYYVTSLKVMAEMGSRTWGITDLSAAEQYGYELPPWTNESSTSGGIDSLSSAERLALIGVGKTSGDKVKNASARSGIPPGGCARKALLEIVAAGVWKASPGQSLVAHIDEESFMKARSSAPVKAVFAKWSVCMLSHGYRYPDPFAPAAAFATATPVTRHEIRVAVTDIECSRKVNVQRVAFAVESAYQNQLIKQNAARLAQVKVQVKREGGALARLVAQYGAGPR
jgi:hypothetical protein